MFFINSSMFQANYGSLADIIVKGVVPEFHSWAHDHLCHMQMNPRRTNHTGLNAFEWMEPLWSYPLSEIKRTVLSMSTGMRHATMIEMFEYISASKLKGLGKNKMGQID